MKIIYCLMFFMCGANIGHAFAQGLDRYEDDFQDGRDSIPQLGEPLVTTDEVLPFYSNITLGAADANVASVSYNESSFSKLEYSLGLGLEYPLFSARNFAVTLGGEFGIRYPMVLNLQPGEPSFHFSAEPVVRVPFGFFFADLAEVDVIPAVAIRVNRHEYPLGTLWSYGAELQLAWRSIWPRFALGRFIPLLSADLRYVPPLGSYKVTSMSPSFAEQDQNGAIPIQTKGDMSGFVAGAQVGFSFSLGNQPAHDELVFSIFYDQEDLKNFKKSFFSTVDAQGSYFSFLTYALAWKRAWSTQ